MAPIRGDIKATTIAVMVIPLDHRTVPIISSGAIALTKYVLYINVIIRVVNG